jgi:hypothetical protein
MERSKVGHAVIIRQTGVVCWERDGCSHAFLFQSHGTRLMLDN